VLLGALATQLVLSLRFALDGWFGVDALHYFSQRGGVPGEHTSIFAPYGGHFQPVLIMMYRALFAVFGLRTYLPYVVPAILAHLLISLLVYAILRRLGTSPWAATVTVWILVFYGAGAEAYLSDAPFALTSALTLGLGAIYVFVRWDRERWSQWVAAGLLTVAIMCSVTGVVSIVLVGAFVLGTRGWRSALAATGPPMAVFLAWFAVSGRHGGRVQGSPSDLLGVPGAVWSVLVKPLADVTAVDGVGTILTLAVVAATFWARGVRPELRVLAWAGILAALAQLTLSALANLAVGPDAVAVGRYRYITLVCLLPAVALSMEAVAARLRVVAPRRARTLPALIVAASLVGMAVNGVLDERHQWRFYTAMGDDFASYTRGTLAANDLGERMLTDHVPGSFVTGPDLRRLSEPVVRDKFAADFRATAEDRVRAENSLYVGVGRSTYELPAPTSLISEDFDPQLSGGLGCRTYAAKTPTPFLSFRSFQGAQIAVTSQSSLIRTRVVRDGVEGVPREWSVKPGDTLFIGTTAQLAQLDVAFDAGGEYTICRA
jgi:hypothetical protein